jgi:hypothetical protein
MTNGYGVHPDAMRDHAGRLDGVVEHIRSAQDAAGQVSLNGTDAYGILCSPVLTPLIGAVEILGMSAIGAADVAVGATATGVRGMAETYDFVEEAVSKTLHDIHGLLDGK